MFSCPKCEPGRHAQDGYSAALCEKHGPPRQCPHCHVRSGDAHYVGCPNKPKPPSLDEAAAAGMDIGRWMRQRRVEGGREV